jgi:hypothetical protein
MWTGENVPQPDSIQAWGGAALTVVALLGVLVAWVRYVRPRLRNVSAQVVGVRDSILGREAIHDSITGREIVPALPGMGVRMAGLESAQAALMEAVAKLADEHIRLEDHERRIVALEVSGFERVVTRAESAQAWRAMEAIAKERAMGNHPAIDDDVDYTD